MRYEFRLFAEGDSGESVRDLDVEKARKSDGNSVATVARIRGGTRANKND